MPRIACFANCPTALPVVTALANGGHLQALAVPSHTVSHLPDLIQAANAAGAQVRTITPESLHTEVPAWLSALKIDCGVINTFPFILPDNVLNATAQGFINFHFAPLPEYRGADPHFWLIRNRESLGGLSVHCVTAGIDEGPLVHEQRIPITPFDTYSMHQVKLLPLGPKALAHCLPLIEAGTLQEMAYPQPKSGQNYHSLPSDNDRTISWTQQSAEEVSALARACNPNYQGAICYLEDMQLYVVEATPDSCSPRGHSPGKIVQACKEKGVLVACKNDTFVRLRVIYGTQGYFSAQRLVELGFGNQEFFASP